MTDRYAARRSRLLKSIKEAKVDALLVTNFTNVTYLTGFTGDSSYLLLGRGVTVLISDRRYETQIEEECPELDATIRPPTQLMPDATAAVLKKASVRKVGFESGSVTVEQHAELAKKCETAEFVPVSGAVEGLREIKDSHEVAAIREAIRQAEKGFAVLESLLIPEMTELQAAHDLEHAMRRFGATRASFDPIVAVGDRAALAHYRPSTRRLSEAGFVLVDWGATGPGGYRSDLTRVLVTGKLPPKLEKVYRVVAAAQQAAIDGIRPGMKCCEADAIARKVIADAGFGGQFGHGLGHGIGLEIHEGPRLSPTSKVELRPGMVVTVEPGVYLPGLGGVRIEDDILITENGCEVLSSVPKEIDQVVVASGPRPSRR